MVHILGFIFIIFVGILLIGIALISTFLRGLFGIGRRATQYASAATSGSAASDRSFINEESFSPYGKKKVFDKEEGEYVEFEEIK